MFGLSDSIRFPRGPAWYGSSTKALRIAAEERDVETLKRLLPAAAQNGVAEDSPTFCLQWIDSSKMPIRNSLRLPGNAVHYLSLYIIYTYIYIYIYLINLFSIHLLYLYTGRHKDARFVSHWEAEVASARHVFDFEACSLLFLF
jgi:hypothetical protein